MPEYNRQEVSPFAQHDVVIGITDTCCNNANQHFTLFGFLQFYGFHDHGFVWLVQYSGFHFHVQLILKKIRSNSCQAPSLPTIVMEETFW